jgi:hypothetical protein
MSTSPTQPLSYPHTLNLTLSLEIECESEAEYEYLISTEGKASLSFIADLYDIFGDQFGAGLGFVSINQITREEVKKLMSAQL